jgi:hypothetical protein
MPAAPLAAAIAPGAAGTALPARAAHLRARRQQDLLL